MNRNCICIAGKNDIAVDMLYYLLDVLKIEKESLCVVVNKTDTGVDSWQKSLLRHAVENNIKVVSLEDLYEVRPLIFLSLEFDRIVIPEKFKTDRLYNIHFSELPKYKGMYTSVMPILNGEKQSGVTFHKIDSGIDTGDIIRQKVFPIPITFTSRDLYFSYLRNGIRLLKEVIMDVLNGEITASPQSEENSTYYSKKAVDFKNMTVDFRKTSYEIHNQLRAFIFEEYQLPKINEIRIKRTILTNKKIDRNHLEEQDDKFIVSGIDGFRVDCYKELDVKPYVKCIESLRQPKLFRREELKTKEFRGGVSSLLLDFRKRWYLRERLL